MEKIPQDQEKMIVEENDEDSLEQEMFLEVDLSSFKSSERQPTSPRMEVSHLCLKKKRKKKSQNLMRNK